MKNLFGEEVRIPKKGESTHTRLTSWYCKWYWKLYQAKCEHSFGHFHKTWKKLLDQYNEQQVMLLTFIHFHWYGPQDNDSRTYKFLYENNFPLGMLIKNAHQYRDYLKYNAGVDLEDIRDVSAYLKEVINMHKIALN